MKFYNIKDHKEVISFIDAVKNGIGRFTGLYFPICLPKLSVNTINDLLDMDFISRSVYILSKYIGNEISLNKIKFIVSSAFNFPLSVIPITKNISSVELFHGPTLAFKDFGSRFMAQLFKKVIIDNKKIIILTATSGDTGAAVAHAFYGIKNIEVIILYPQGKVSYLQEKLFCTIGGNIHTISVEGSFDICQDFVKKALEDIELNSVLYFNSANSINISRLLSQICYYFEAVSQVPKHMRNNLVFSVPSGNFGNLTAGLLAKTLGLPIKRFIAGTNVNNTVLRFLNTGIWSPYPTITTLSNAMDVSEPNNWPRIVEIFKIKKWKNNILSCKSVNDDIIVKTMKNLFYNIGYICDPHSSIGYNVLSNNITSDEYGLFLSTAHPAKFKDVIDKVLDSNITIPLNLLKCIKLPILSSYISAEFNNFRNILLKFRDY